jgi:hypothetical protein
VSSRLSFSARASRIAARGALLALLLCQGFALASTPAGRDGFGSKGCPGADTRLCDAVRGALHLAPEGPLPAAAASPPAPAAMPARAAPARASALFRAQRCATDPPPRVLYCRLHL